MGLRKNNSRMVEGLPFINVKDLGAVGDGISDDTEFFKTAIATGKNVYIPEGTYIIDPSIGGTTTKGFPLSSGQKIIGSGNSTVLDIQIPSGRSALFEVTDTQWTDISDFKVLGNSSGPFDESYTATDGLSFICYATSTVDWGVSNNSIHHLEVSEFSGLLGTPYYRAGDSDPRFPQREWHVHNCKVSYTTSHGVGGNFIHNSLIENNEFRNIGPLCVDFSTEGSGNIIRGNFCSVASGFAKFQEHTSDSVNNFHKHGKIIDNTAYGLHGGAGGNVHGIKVQGLHNEVSGNTLLSVSGAYAGIQLGGDGIISNNDLHMDNSSTSQGGIKIESGAYGGEDLTVTICGNRVDGWRQSIRIENGAVHKELNITENSLTSCEKGIIATFSGNNLDRMIISNNKITADHSNSVNNFGIQFGTGTGQVNQLILTGNNIYSYSNCVMLYKTSSVIASNNIVETAAGSLIIALSDVTNALISNNYGKGGTWGAESIPPTYGDLSGVAYYNNYLFG